MAPKRYLENAVLAQLQECQKKKLCVVVQAERRRYVGDRVFNLKSLNNHVIDRGKVDYRLMDACERRARACVRARARDSCARVGEAES